MAGGRQTSLCAFAVIVATATQTALVGAASRAGSQELPGAIVFERNDDVGSDVFVVTPDGTRETRLTEAPGEDFAPSVDADGRIVFVSGRGRTFRIFSMRADGLKQGPFAAATAASQYQPTVTRDGQRIAFAAGPVGRSDILQAFSFSAFPRDVPRANSKRDDGWPDWHPDGRTLVFSSNRDGAYRLYVAQPGGRPIPVTEKSLQAVEPSWSPKGDRIAFTGIDGKGNYDIYTIRYPMPPKGSLATRVTDNPAQDIQPSWAPDNKTLAFASDRDSAGEENWEIYLHTADGKERRVTHDPAADLAPAWSPVRVIRAARRVAANPTPPLTCTKGTDLPDKLVGDGSDETICGKKANDTIDGNGGDDVIYAGDGNDVAAGGGGSDSVSGGVGADKLKGGAGADKFYLQDRGTIDLADGGPGPPGAAKDRVVTRDAGDKTYSIET